MELSEFEAIVSELDARIASAKARREAIEKRLREAIHRQSAVESRVAELKRLGEGAGENVLAFSARLKAEAEAVQAELVAEFPEAAQQAVPEAAATQPPPLDFTLLWGAVCAIVAALFVLVAVMKSCDFV